MKWHHRPIARFAALALALAVFKPAGPPASLPVCPSVTEVTALMQGQSYGVRCSNGTRLTVTPPRATAAGPALGPSRVVRADGYRVLIDAAGVEYPIL